MGVVLGIMLGLYWGNGKEKGNYYKDSSIPGTRLGFPFEGSGERALGFRASGLGLKA